MNLTLTIQIATLISILIGIFAFFRGVHQYNKQMNVQVFLQYAKRYEEIMTSFPKNARVVRLQSQKALPNSSGELSLWALRYLNLCSEEFYLYKANYLSKKSMGHTGGRAYSDFRHAFVST